MHLTAAQRMILLSACKHELGHAKRPPKLTEASAAKMATLLIERGFVREVIAKAGRRMWREDESRGYALKIMKAGRDAVTNDQAGGKTIAEPAVSLPQADGTRDGISGTKTSIILDLMRRSEGASLPALTNATGWLPHTIRAALSGLRKKGIVIDRSDAKQGGSIYRIRDAPQSRSTA